YRPGALSSGTTNEGRRDSHRQAFCLPLPFVFSSFQSNCVFLFFGARELTHLLPLLPFYYLSSRLLHAKCFVVSLLCGRKESGCIEGEQTCSISICRRRSRRSNR